MAQNRLYHVGPHPLILPPEHRLDHYQARWQRYDIALGEISRILAQRVPGYAAIDVGANIGDTAALLRKYAPVPVLCIEGHPDFIGLLRANTARMGNGVAIETCFIGQDGNFVNVARAQASRGTASLVGALSPTPSVTGVPCHSLATVLARHPRFAQARLLKLDTDGFDFPILIQSAAVLAQLKPVLFFEYDPSFSPQGNAEAGAAIATLEALGYRHYLVYDNFGNFLMSVDNPARFQELNIYLRSNRQYGQVAVHYFDVCACHADDRALFEAILGFELSL